MAGKKNGFSFVFQFQKQLPHLLHALVVETVHRFIQNQKGRFLHNRLCNTETLAHAERILADMLFRFRIQSDFSDGRIDLLFSDLPADAGEKLQILSGTVARKKARCLDDGANTLRRFDLFPNLFSIHKNRAIVHP